MRAGLCYSACSGLNSSGNFRLIQNSHGGKAKAVMTGMQDANGEIILFTDMDQATPINQIEKVIPQFERGFDIVIGSRQGRKGAPFVRKLAAWGFSVLRGIILGLPFKDTQTGFKAFKGDIIRKLALELRSNRFGFEPEITARIAKIKDIKIYEVGISYTGRTYAEGKKIGWKDGVRAIWEIVKFNLSS